MGMVAMYVERGVSLKITLKRFLQSAINIENGLISREVLDQQKVR